MAKCKRCGRWGLFLKLNRNGLCAECEKKAFEEQNRINRQIKRQMIESENKAKAAASEVEINISAPSISVDMFPECVIHIDNKPALKSLLERYTTEEYDDSFVKFDRFISVNVPHEYSDAEFSYKLKYIVYQKLRKLSSYKKWIRDATAPDAFFSNYDGALAMLTELSEFEPYFEFYKPVPHEMYADYFKNRETYTAQFIKRWWDSTLSKASSLKTDDGKINKIEKCCAELRLYSKYLSEGNKNLIENLRSSVNVNEIKKAEKPLPEFDYEKEKQLLQTLKSSLNRVQNKHFALIELQNFYYKYRKLDDQYIKLCREYCQKDIDLLPKLDESYKKEQISMIKRLSQYHDEALLKEDQKEIDQINKTGFNGTIPAFKRMSMICENDKDYDGAIYYCDAAIQHYLNHGYKADSVTIEEFNKRRDKLIAKKSKMK